MDTARRMDAIPATRMGRAEEVKACRASISATCRIEHATILHDCIAIGLNSYVEVSTVRLSNYCLCVLVLCLSTQANNTNARVVKSSTALRCGIDPEKSAARILANPDGKHGWREYRNVKDVPELELGIGQFARLWTETHGMILIRLEEPGEDFAAYTDYCFDKDGQLVALKYSLRTAWGWGYREEGPVTNGRLTPQMSEFFDTNNEAPVKRPEQADDIPDALKPHLYARKSRLPFAKFLPK